MRKSCILLNSVSVGMFEIFMIETCLWFLYTVTLPHSVPGGWIKKQHKRCWLTVEALPDGHLEVPYSLLCTFVYTSMCPFPASLPLSPKNVFFKKLDQLTNIILFQSIRGDNERNQMLAKRNSGDWTKETRKEAICTGEFIAAVVPFFQRTGSTIKKRFRHLVAL